MQKQDFKKAVSALLSGSVLLSVVTALPVTASESASSTAVFEYDGYTVDYVASGGLDNNQNIDVVITNTGDSAIDNWELMYDDFGGVITDIQNAVVVKNNSGEKLAELKSEYGDNSELSELLNTFEEKYISELEVIRHTDSNATILPDESVAFSYTLTDFTGIPGWIGFKEDKPVQEEPAAAETHKEGNLSVTPFGGSGVYDSLGA